MIGVHYTLKRSHRARNLRVSVRAGGEVILTAPVALSTFSIERFLSRHTDWIRRAQQRMSHLKALPIKGRRDYLKHKEEARAFIEERVREWNRHYGFSYNRIAIKNTQRLWGSCSRKGNLNFSYALLFLPRELADYVVVHELCHLKEHNHSARFWALVAEAQSNYKELRQELRRYQLR